MNQTEPEWTPEALKKDMAVWWKEGEVKHLAEGYTLIERDGWMRLTTAKEKGDE